MCRFGLRDAARRVRAMRDVDDDNLGAVGADSAEQLFGELLGALGVEDPDDGQDIRYIISIPAKCTVLFSASYCCSFPAGCIL